MVVHFTGGGVDLDDFRMSRNFQSEFTAPKVRKEGVKS